MIKKIFISLLSIVGLGISFTSAYSCNYSVSNYFCTDYLNFGQSDTSNMYFGGSVKDKNFNFSGYNNFIFSFNIPLNGQSFNVLNYYWVKNGLRYTSRFADGDNEYNGFIDGFYVCSSRPGNSYAHLDRKDFCVYHDGFDDFGQYISNASTYVFACNRGYPNNIQSKDVNCVVCVCNGNCGYGKQHICIDKSKTSANLNGFVSTAEIVLDKKYGPNPVFDPDYYIVSYNSGGNVSDINLDLDNTIKYYENRFGWDIGMCYVGTNNLTGFWGENIPFTYYSGATLFELYYSLYGTFGSNSIQNVGSFINTWLLNYYSWYSYFGTGSDDRIYMANYNGPDQNITMIYTGFTFPFANKPIAIFYLIDMLADQYVAENSQGEEIAYYCDLLLNYHAYADGIKSFDDLNNLINPNIRDRIKGYNDLTLGSQNGYSTPGSSGTWSNYSGYAIPSDLSPTSLFKDLYNKIDNLSSGFSPLNTVGIIPWWILYPLIFLVLFRILRH